MHRYPLGCHVEVAGLCIPAYTYVAYPDSCAFIPAVTVFLKLTHDAVRSPFQLEAPNFCVPAY